MYAKGFVKSYLSKIFIYCSMVVIPNWEFLACGEKLFVNIWFGLATTIIVPAEKKSDLLFVGYLQNLNASIYKSDNFFTYKCIYSHINIYASLNKLMPRCVCMHAVYLWFMNCSSWGCEFEFCCLSALVVFNHYYSDNLFLLLFQSSFSMRQQSSMRFWCCHVAL